ncbi:NAD(P)-linked oxidoreductase superfamily protein [Zea mays]|uniref:NAD(P)-linked oxidoreductase superfamily protein n=1 Tax=Zea mays TaxID=4577 RepID=A0A1D6N9A0_MAIZE|nr:NAD(P)-linked oxidoreductase superfamily protein [Zea mays]
MQAVGGTGTSAGRTQSCHRRRPYPEFFTSTQQMAMPSFAVTSPPSHGTTLWAPHARRPQRLHKRHVCSQVRAAAQAQLQYQKLGDSDFLISEVTLGTMTFGEQNMEKEAHDIIAYSFDQGYPVPMNKETQGRTDLYIDRWMQSKPRDKIILATKVAGYSERSTFLRDNAKVVRVDAANIKVELLFMERSVDSHCPGMVVRMAER